jgi:hypothetical protein
MQSISLQQARRCLLNWLVLQANLLVPCGAKTRVYDPRGGFNEVARAVQASRGRGVTVDLQEALDAGNSNLDAGIHGHGQTYITAMHRAAKFGDVAVVEALLAAGASPEGTPPPGATPRGVYWTPLHQAAAFGKVDACDALVAAGHSLNVRDNRGFDPLHMARQNENDAFKSWPRIVTAGTPAQLNTLSLEALKGRVAAAAGLEVPPVGQLEDAPAPAWEQVGMRDLTALALQQGIADEHVDEAMDTNDPRAALVQLLHIAIPSPTQQQPVGAASDSPTDYAKQLAAVYRVHNPDGLSNISAMLQKYSGREAALFETVLAKYELNSEALEKVRIIDAIWRFHGAQLVQEFELDVAVAEEERAFAAAEQTKQEADEAYAAKKATMTPVELAQEDEKDEL